MKLQSLAIGFALGVTLASCNDTSGDDCYPGGPGCECVNGACQPGLVCVTGICFPDQDEAGDAGDGDADGDGGLVEPDNVGLDDTDRGVVVTIDGGTATGWRFGNIYPSADFYDEACLGDNDCHLLDGDGGTLGYCDSIESCTSMPRIYWRTGSASYVLISEAGLGCFVWGDDADYWDSLGCIETDWETSSYY